MDSVVYLAIAVILFRGFAAEGYMISTGSMAPCLLGYHRQIVCPACSFAFCRGVQFDGEEVALASPSARPEATTETESLATACPNCGLQSIDTGGVPRNEGDQLLVHKHLYQLRPPRRWEVVVFRHPTDVLQAYVKRVVGLPHETMEIVDGDVYADGILQRKSLETQRSMRICVYDHDHVPEDPEWHPRWQAGADKSWTAGHAGFLHRSGQQDAAASGEAGLAPVKWLTYHHWIRRGGNHRTDVALEQWPTGVPEARELDFRLSYDMSVLTYQGVLPSATARRFHALSTDARWQAAIDELERRSHESPITDGYGYNHPAARDESVPIHDLMIEALVARVGPTGRWCIQMSDGHHLFTAVFDMDGRQVQLYTDEKDQPLRISPLPDGAFVDETTIEMSLFDRQIMLAIDGELPFAPVPYSAVEGPRRMTATPVRIGAAGVDLHLTHLRLYRDVHYTAREHPGQQAVTRLGADEFYMLGDNSPVSLDSRAWHSPAIPRDLLIGKPFVVHLPSRQGQLEIAGKVYHFRIPDFSRVRYIR